MSRRHIEASAVAHKGEKNGEKHSLDILQWRGIVAGNIHACFVVANDSRQDHRYRIRGLVISDCILRLIQAIPRCLPEKVVVK